MHNPATYAASDVVAHPPTVRPLLHKIIALNKRRRAMRHTFVKHNQVVARPLENATTPLAALCRDAVSAKPKKTSATN